MIKIKAAVISLGSKSSKWVTEAMGKYFEVVDALDLRKVEVMLTGKTAEILYQGKQIEQYDCVYLKGSYRYWPLLASISSVLPPNVYTPIKSESFAIGHDKILTHLVMANGK